MNVRNQSMGAPPDYVFAAPHNGMQRFSGNSRAYDPDGLARLKNAHRDSKHLLFQRSLSPRLNMRLGSLKGRLQQRRLHHGFPQDLANEQMMQPALANAHVLTGTTSSDYKRPVQ
ncbi:hypothetical protein A9D60_21530 [Leisingera sp. JC1]|nr:hypothetical protein A9D60_21530 [Leisingera sp. JC1]